VRSRIAVLASGGGSNLQALLDHLQNRGNERGGDVVLVASDRPTAGALERARKHSIATGLLGDQGGARPLGELLSAHDVEMVALAGYLRLVEGEVVERFGGRIVNVHPALLPAFGGKGMYGENVHRAVIQSGARVTGVTVHTIDNEYDRGRIIAQWPVPVLPGDDAHTLAARVLAIEHVLYPRVVDAMAAGHHLNAITSPPFAALAAFAAFAASDDAAAAAASIERMIDTQRSAATRS
jgi:formyltetrahydrofolate-dependent phosphoribosylglycinamide formyltransferase